MYRVIILVGFVLRCTESGQDNNNDYTYDYSDTNIEDIIPIGGDRLIGARAADDNESSFVGALYITSYEKIKSPICTAALISPDLALR